uniref:Hepatoma-derived growth factor-related protein 2 n=1 Tax=Lygus hesperus TaxID=30085 RepID=A0A0A9WME0_LYGHE
MKPKFNPGAKVFAKVRGYPPWPARIEGCADETPKKEKYHVYFYGTGETAVVKIQDVFDFVENRNKMGKLKKLKNFTEAMQQVESELSPEQKAAIKALDSEQTASPSVKDTEKGSKEVDTPKEKETRVETTESTPAPNRRTSTASKSAKSTPAASVKPAPKDNKRKLELDSSPDDSAPTPKKLNTSATPTSTTSEKKEDRPQSKPAEPQSRSGRKIKPKKFNDFEDDGKEEQKEESSPVKEEEKKPKDAPKRPMPRPKSLKGADDNADSGAGDWYLLARCPTKNQDPIKIPIKLNRPDFEDKKPRSITQSQWEIWFLKRHDP